jgi:probable rRNA maturation factor
MDVFLADEQDVEIDEERVVALARTTLDAEAVEGEVELSLLLVTAEHMRKLNSRFAGNDYATDVLAFPMSDDDDDDEDDDDVQLLGDVVICPAVARENAGRLGHSLRRELDTLVVHGTLHLLGYDHQGKHDRARMEARVRDVLAAFEHVRT